MTMTRLYKLIKNKIWTKVELIYSKMTLLKLITLICLIWNLEKFKMVMMSIIAFIDKNKLKKNKLKLRVSLNQLKYFVRF